MPELLLEWEIEDHESRQYLEVVKDSWPEFMLNDPVANNNWDALFQMFPQWQFSILDKGKIIAVANSIPIRWDRPVEELPEEGWDWALSTALEQAKSGVRPNMLVGLSITVCKERQGEGLSRKLLTKLKDQAGEAGYMHVLIAVRPTIKWKYPLMSMDDYCRWKRDDGLPFDDWLRVHVRNDGKIIKPCHRAMEIPGSIKDWQNWTGMNFPVTGKYTVPFTLTPVEIDVPNNKGLYIEPNVWVVHNT